MVIPEVRQERLYQKIANLIIKLINDNIFPPGTFLPPERELPKHGALLPFQGYKYQRYVAIAQGLPCHLATSVAIIIHSV